MRCAHARKPPRNDLSALGNKLRQQSYVFVIDRLDLLDAKLADLLAAEVFTSALAAPSRTSAPLPVSVAWARALRRFGRCRCFWCSHFVSHRSPSRRYGHPRRTAKSLLCWRYRRLTDRFRRGCRSCAGFLSRLPDLLDLVEPLLLFINAHGDELDHRFGHAQTTLQFVDDRAVAFHRQQYEDSIMETANGVCEPPLSPNFALHGSTSRRH